MPANIDADQLNEKWKSAFTNKDPGPIMDVVADDITFNDPISGGEMRGGDAFRENVQRYVQSFDMEEMEVQQSVQSGNEMAIVVRARLKHTGEMELPTGDRAPATNRSVEMEFADFVTFNDEGRMIRDRTIMDTGALMRQLGLMEEQAPTP